MSDNEILNTILGGSIILIVILFILVIAVAVLYTVSLWKLFKKAGKNGWEALIPFYSTYVLIEIAGLNWWYFLIAIAGTIFARLNIKGLSFIVDVGTLLVNFFIFYNLAKKMNKQPTGIAIVGTFFPGIVIPIMGLSKNYEYDSSVSVSPNGPIGESKENTSNEPEKYCLGCGQKIKPGIKFCENCGREVK